MNDVPQILSKIEQGDPSAAEQLLPLVELRKLATAKLANEKPGQTLQAAALVHEAYLRLVGSGDSTYGRLACSRFENVFWAGRSRRGRWSFPAS